MITGSSRGIGFHMAKEFLKLGHRVVLNGRNTEVLTIATEKLRNLSAEIVACQGDVSHESTHHTLVDKAIDQFGRIDIWINNAGIPQDFRFFHDLDTRDIEKLVNVNITGTLLGSRVALSFFRKQKFGSLYNMEGFGSDGRMMSKLILYGTSKRAVSYFTRSLLKETRHLPIQIGTINPGMVRTEFIDIDRNFEDEKEEKQYEKVVRILAEDVEPVSKSLVRKILQNKKSFHPVKYLSGWKLALKITKLTFN